MAEETLRSNLDRAFDPGPDFPHPSLLSRTMAMLDAEAAPPHLTRSATRRVFPRSVMRLVAGALMIVLALAAVAVFLATHHPIGPVPVHTPPGPRLMPAPPFKIVGPGAGVCQSACGLGSPLFVSANVGWLTENVTPDTSNAANCTPGCAGTVVLFRTEDGGFHWKSEATWDGWAQDILATPDGREVTVVGSPDTPGAGVLHSIDGGAHWTTFGYPPSAGQAVQQNCKLGTPPCFQQTLNAQVGFVNPREGWVFSQEGTYTVADLFRTTDAGAHWAMTRIDIKAAFNVDVGKGVADPKGNVDHSLNGKLVFHDSSNGWFLTYPSWDIFITHDGGSSWQKQSIPRPAGTSADLIAIVDSVRLFSNARDGVLSLRVRAPSWVGPAPPSAIPTWYVYSTSDGGAHWSKPTHPPSVDVPTQPPGPPAFVDMTFDFIDATHWVGWPQPPAMGPAPLQGFMQTSDAGGHWAVLPAPAFQVSGWFEFLDPSHGWVYGGDSSGSRLYRTSDGGVTWVSLSLPELS